MRDLIKEGVRDRVDDRSLKGEKHGRSLMSYSLASRVADSIVMKVA
jgi:hypothetical protein